MSQQLCPPEMFGIVETGIYRSNLFFPISFPFIKLLNLKTVLLLSAEVPTKVVCNFLEENDITLVHLGSRSLTTETSWKPMSEELVKDGLEWVLDRKSHPLLVCDTSGIHQVGILVGCLRRLQNWSLSAVIHEYRTFASSKARYVNEQFIELFDVDLITLPEDLPDWFREHLEQEAKEIEEYQQLIRKKELDPLGVLIKANHNVPRYQQYFYSHEAKLHFPQGQKDIRIERYLPRNFDLPNKNFHKWRQRERVPHEQITKVKSPADVEIRSVRKVIVRPPSSHGELKSSLFNDSTDYF
ncbi:Probable tyrosine-protein phosphatase [Galdieria sulphuraria]|nr:Probable tyrosine-protein phosphatase [Galdieria sulphuraria]